MTVSCPVSLTSALGTGLAAVVKIKLVAAGAAVTVIVGAGLLTYESLSPGPQERAAPAPPAAPDRRNPVSPSARTTAKQPQPGGAVETPRPEPAEPLAVASAPAQPTRPQPKTDEPVVASDAGAAKNDSPRLDLSSPQAAVRSFTRAFASGDAQSVMACMLPGGTDYEDIQNILNASPDGPDQRDNYQMKLWLQALDPDAEMPIIEVKEGPRGREVTWQVTYRKDVTLAGQTFRAGDTFNLDATLRKSDDSWLIDGI